MLLSEADTTCARLREAQLSQGVHAAKVTHTSPIELTLSRTSLL